MMWVRTEKSLQSYFLWNCEMLLIKFLHCDYCCLLVPRPCLYVYFSGGAGLGGGGVSAGNTQIVTVTDPVTGQPVQQLIQTQIDPSTGQATQVVLPATNVVTVKDPVTGQYKQQNVPTSINDQGIFTLGSPALIIKTPHLSTRIAWNILPSGKCKSNYDNAHFEMEFDIGTIFWNPILLVFTSCNKLVIELQIFIGPKTNNSYLWIREGRYGFQNIVYLLKTIRFWNEIYFNRILQLHLGIVITISLEVISIWFLYKLTFNV